MQIIEVDQSNRELLDGINALPPELSNPARTLSKDDLQMFLGSETCTIIAAIECNGGSTNEKGDREGRPKKLIFLFSVANVKPLWL